MEFKGDISGLDKLSGILEEYYIERFAKAGELACAEAVIKGFYQNITGNLRSSIGYMIGYEGKIIREGGFHKVQGRGENSQRVMFSTRSGNKVDFWAKGKYGDGTAGSEKGKKIAQEIIKSTKGYSYVIVVGMEYASYVNSKGYDVYDSAQLTLGNLLGTNVKIIQWQE